MSRGESFRSAMRPYRATVVPQGPPRPVGGRGPRRAPPPAAPPLGDVDDDVLREALHRVAEWAAEYRETIEQRRIAPRVEPGEVASRLPPSAPLRGEPLERILADLETV